MGNYTIFGGSKILATNVPKILDLKSSSKQIIIFQKLSFGAPEPCPDLNPHPNFLQHRKWGVIPLGHATTAQFNILKINPFEVFFSTIHTVETLWSCNYHEFKDTFEEK